MRLETSNPRCVLRPWFAADRDDLVRNANNVKVWRNLTDTFPHPYTEADALAWFEIAAQPGRSLHLAIEFERVAVGGIGAIAGEGVNRATAQFGYWMGEAYWGQGLATAAAAAFLEHIESERLFVRLEAPVFEWNPRSMWVLEKLGFTREGVLRSSITKDGELIDSIMYAYVVGTDRSLTRRASGTTTTSA